MRHTNLAFQLGANASLTNKYRNQGIELRTQRYSDFPICWKCSQPGPGNPLGRPKIVDVAGIEERGPDPDFPRWFEVRVECHGEEDYGRVEFRGRLHPDHWATVLGTGVFFREHREKGMVQVVQNLANGGTLTPSQRAFIEKVDSNSTPDAVFTEDVLALPGKGATTPSGEGG